MRRRASEVLAKAGLGTDVLAEQRAAAKNTATLGLSCRITCRPARASSVKGATPRPSATSSGPESLCAASYQG